jgi:hypothetical protein
MNSGRRTPKPEMDFFADLSVVTKQKLIGAGYTVDANATPDSICVNYMNVLRRRVAVGPRDVKTAKTLDCPTDLKSGFERFVEKTKSGADLRPHQSTRIKDSDYEDAMLNDWGIHHFHLGTSTTARGFIERTGPILYALVTPSTLYCIGVLPHNEWANQEMIEIVHREWPEAIERFRLKGVRLLAPITDQDRLKFRKAGLNAMTSVQDGTVYAPLGGGYTTARTSAMVRMAVNDWRHLCRKLEEIVAGHGAFFLEGARSANVTLPAKFRISLRFLHGMATAFEPSSEAKLHLAEWSIPDL